MPVRNTQNYVWDSRRVRRAQDRAIKKYKESYEQRTREANARPSLIRRLWNAWGSKDEA